MDWRCLQQKISPILTLVGCIGGLSIALPASTPDVSVSAPDALVGQSLPQLSLQQLHSSAIAITVKVLSTDFLGSGFLIQKQGDVYTVLTNDHVLRAGDPPYRIQTPDGRIYPAHLPKKGKFKANDLAILQFRSPGTAYAVASLGSSFSLTVGQEVFAAGFPFADRASRPRSRPVGKGGLEGFFFTAGKVSLVLDKALEGGYQVGYTNDIEKGMSGGPLLNRRGEVVGVNGKHSYPIWDVPSVFEDGSKACLPLHKMINRSSWAVPIDRVVQLAPLSMQLNSRLKQPLASVAIQPKRSHMVFKRDRGGYKLPLVEQAIAKKSCVPFPAKLVREGNPSN